MTAKRRYSSTHSSCVCEWLLTGLSCGNCENEGSPHEMLRLAGVEPERRVSRTLSEYVPFEIVVGGGSYSHDDSFYWRATDATYLFETKADARTGLVLGVDLVLIPRNRVQLVSRTAPIVPKVERGVPIVDLDPWRARIGANETAISMDPRRIDEPVPFSLLIGNDGLALLFDSVAPAERMIQTGDLGFLWDAQGLLTGVVLGGISAAEQSHLAEVWLSSTSHGSPEPKSGAAEEDHRIEGGA
jgi:hypothetical protein